MASDVGRLLVGNSLLAIGLLGFAHRLRVTCATQCVVFLTTTNGTNWTNEVRLKFVQFVAFVVVNVDRHEESRFFLVTGCAFLLFSSEAEGVLSRGPNENRGSFGASAILGFFVFGSSS